MRDLIAATAETIEVIAVATIVVAIVYGSARFLLHIKQRAGNAYEQYKAHLGRGL
jgi:hypothetical protein